MVKIKIDEYYIRGYKDGYEIYIKIPGTDKDGILTGRMVRAQVRWYPTLEQACARLYSILVSRSDAKSILDLQKYMEKTKNEIIEAVRAEFR